jgi:hypothetical protein
MVGEAVHHRSLRRHLDGHCRVLDDGEAAQAEARAAEGDELLEGILTEVDGWLSSGQMIEPAALLDLQQKLYLVSLRRQLAQGQVPNMTADQGARAADRLMAAAKKAREADLLGALVGGIGQVMQRELDVGPAALPPVEVEGEVIAEDEGEL